MFRLFLVVLLYYFWSDYKLFDFNLVKSRYSHVDKNPTVFKGTAGIWNDFLDWTLSLLHKKLNLVYMNCKNQEVHRP